MASHIVPVMEQVSHETFVAAQTAEIVYLNPQTTSTTTPATPARPTNPLGGTSGKLSVPLDSRQSPTAGTTITTSRKIARRDSLDRREASLKGKEGSRQRRRWENDRLLNNPYAVPPLPQDWEVRPTYPVRRVPYYLAPLWDAAEFQRAIERNAKGRRNTRSSRKKHTSGMSPFEEDAINISREVRGRLKHARSAKGLLQDLEEDVRRFLIKWDERERRLREEGLHDAPLPRSSLPIRPRKTEDESAIASDTEPEEDEEIVFVGRGGTISSDSPTRKKREVEENLLSEKLVFEGLEHDKGAAFGRWLAHCVGSYYGLRTWSVTTTSANDSRLGKAAQDIGGQRVRQAYVGVDARVRGWMGQGWESGRDFELPRPLWAMV